jgi:signal peptidase I
MSEIQTPVQTHSHSSHPSEQGTLAGDPGSQERDEWGTGASTVLVPAKHLHVGFLPAVQSLLYVLVGALFVMTFTVQPIRIPSESMEPTLLVGDFLMMDKQMGGDAHGLLPPAEVHRGDVVVFHDPVDDPSVHLVKRVIGIPGDRIHLRDGVVIRNGERLKEPYAVYRESPEDRFRDDFPDMQTMQARVNPEWWIRLRGMVRDGEITVPAGHYFVMGDNRNDSEDSRYWGFVPKDAIVGRPFLIYFSWRQPGVDEDIEAWGIHAEQKSGVLGFGRWDRTLKVVR